MNRADRAKQFLPFDSLKGLQEELREREKKHFREEKRELSDGEKDELSNILIKLDKGDTVRVTFFYNGYYVVLTDKVTKKNEPYKFITVGEAKIFFDDIYKLERLYGEP